MIDKPYSKFQIIANTTMIIWTLIIVLPFILLLMSSITDENVLVANGYSFFPKKTSLDAYRYISSSGAKILNAYGISIIVTIMGTLLHVLLAALMAFPLSIKITTIQRRFNVFCIFYDAF